MKRNLATFFGLVLFCVIFVPALRAGEPCCGITSINAKTGEVTARVNATGQTLSFTVTDAKVLSAMKVGQAIYANLATRQVSVNGIEPCCGITALSAVPPPGTPCCTVTSVNSQTGQVIVKENATGRLITIKVGSAGVGPVDAAKLAQTFKVGTAVGIGPVDGLKAGARTQLMVAGIGPIDGVVSQIAP
jgi:hypothetical protein